MMEGCGVPPRKRHFGTADRGAGPAHCDRGMNNVI